MQAGNLRSPLHLLRTYDRSCKLYPKLVSYGATQRLWSRVAHGCNAATASAAVCKSSAAEGKWVCKRKQLVFGCHWSE